MKLKPKKIRIGQKLKHNEKGEIEVLGISPHCGDYLVNIKNGWVYLKNCTAIK